MIDYPTGSDARPSIQHMKPLCPLIKVAKSLQHDSRIGFAVLKQVMSRYNAKHKVKTRPFKRWVDDEAYAMHCLFMDAMIPTIASELNLDTQNECQGQH